MIKYRIDMEILALSVKIPGCVLFSDRSMAVIALGDMNVSLVQAGLYGISLEIVEDK